MLQLIDLFSFLNTTPKILDTRAKYKNAQSILLNIKEIMNNKIESTYKV